MIVSWYRKDPELPLLCCLCTNESLGSISDPCQAACWDTSQGAEALPFLCTVLVSAASQLVLIFLFRTSHMLDSYHLSTRSPLFQTRYHQLLTLQQLAHLQLVPNTWGCTLYSRYGLAGKKGRADIYILNRKLQV